MGGIPIIVLVVFLVIWVLTNVLRAQQDDSRNNRRPPVGPTSRPANQPIERGTATDIDRFLAEIDRLRQKGKPEEEAASAQRPSAAPTAVPARPKPQPRPQPAAARPRPVAPSRPTVGSRPTVTPPSLPPTPPPPAPPPALQPPAPTPVGSPVPLTLNVIDQRFADAARQLDRSTLPAAPPVAAAPSARKPPQKGSAMDVVQTLLRGRRGAAAAILIGEILGQPKSKRR